MIKPHRLLKSLVCVVLMTASIGYASMGYAASEKHESTGEYVDDSVITTKVKSAIFNDATLKTMQIKVKTYKGVVQLSGFVDSAQSVTRAGEVAKRVKGVKEVKNDLVVK